MFKKKEYFMLLGIGIGVFFIVFFVTYFIMRKVTPEPEYGAPQGLGQVAREVGSQNIKEQGIKEQAVLPDIKQITIKSMTSIELMLIDETGRLVETQSLDPLTLISYDEKTLKQKFNPCEIIKFTEEKVVLQKVVKGSSVEPHYTLGIQDGVLCIIERGEANQFIKLGIDVNQFSRQTYSALLKEEIHITSQEREKLLKNATYIETILQSYEGE
ncbi:hypothetical protein CS063_03685 [Sporanaerobium hydrogeniformans]|uniref:Uncharacterized protein n=1 Tax=Sporanaerobium hydrogeniformans TaxID=3072179 RepID=A0AC61DEG8_9FIRM|nr:hypothetical protein [Sporanaerobium hydrogeniformans]PHV71674.1 hypothetical protein CS063_03685 [Sporanaerobium hydrogeniformans]